MKEGENLLLPLDPHDHPDCQVMYWSKSEINAIKQYATKCINPILADYQTLRAENAKLIAERDRYKLIVLNTMRQKAVGEVTEDNGVLGAVFYKDAEMQLGETIYAIPVSALALQERIDILLAEREQWMKQVVMREPGEALIQGHMAGQANAGVDPSYFNARVWALHHQLPAQQVTVDEATSAMLRASQMYTEPEDK